MAVAVHSILGRGTETAATPHYMSIGQDMGKATVIPATYSALQKKKVGTQKYIPISAAARWEEQARWLATSAKRRAAKTWAATCATIATWTEALLRRRLLCAILFR